MVVFVIAAIAIVQFDGISCSGSRRNYRIGHIVWIGPCIGVPVVSYAATAINSSRVTAKGDTFTGANGLILSGVCTALGR